MPDVEGTGLASEGLTNFDLIFDVNFDDNPHNIKYYAGLNGKWVIVSAVKRSLDDAVNEWGDNIQCRLVGMNLLPTFIKREKQEISLYNKEDKKELDAMLQNINWNPIIVQDRVGMVTPRVVLMIINEACYTVQEGTASIDNIDTGMKLGTNYPGGPFQWADEIGIKEVYETLLAIYEDTKEERYKICPLLKTKYLRKERFRPES